MMNDNIRYNNPKIRREEFKKRFAKDDQSYLKKEVDKNNNLNDNFFDFSNVLKNFQLMNSGGFLRSNVTNSLNNRDKRDYYVETIENAKKNQSEEIMTIHYLKHQAALRAKNKNNKNCQNLANNENKHKCNSTKYKTTESTKNTTNTNEDRNNVSDNENRKNKLNQNIKVNKSDLHPFEEIKNEYNIDIFLSVDSKDGKINPIIKQINSTKNKALYDTNNNNINLEKSENKDHISKISKEIILNNYNNYGIYSNQNFIDKKTITKEKNSGKKFQNQEKIKENNTIKKKKVNPICAFLTMCFS